MAFMFGVRSPTGNASLIVDSSQNMLAYGLESYPLFSDSNNHLIPSEIQAILTYKKNYGDGNNSITIFSTSPPSYSAALLVASIDNVKGFIYFPKTEANKNALDIIKAVYTDIEAYKGNLNWIRDYFIHIDHK